MHQVQNLPPSAESSLEREGVIDGASKPDRLTPPARADRPPQQCDEGGRFSHQDRRPSAVLVRPGGEMSQCSAPNRGQIGVRRRPGERRPGEHHPEVIAGAVGANVTTAQCRHHHLVKVIHVGDRSQVFLADGRVPERRQRSKQPAAVLASSPQLLSQQRRIRLIPAQLIREIGERKACVSRGGHRLADL